MKCVKIKIKNLFGISEYEMNGQSVELSGKNGAGKTSVIDAIRYGLTNKSDRDYIVRNGENEGEIIIETDNGIRIDRKSRANQADYKSVKKDGREVGSPESFLRDIFTTLQISPVELELDSRQESTRRRKIKYAGFPYIKTMDELDYNRFEHMNTAFINELASCGFVSKRQNM